MSRSLQDQFIDDDEEETCPLCVEEFDLTDKGFRPCPCGYQICQFCYHNVKTNMNGLCPACRRPYKDENIEYKVITSEETAAHKARLAQKQKKNQAALQKEKQKAEADNLSRKHLAGLRVVQKNLVYVTGLSPNSQEDQLLQTLRGEQYFGQYGKIIKIVVSKARDPAHPQSVGVYVTYERKEDAASCIAAVDGSRNGDRTLRAQFGTTKYCSAYLRNEPCTNRNCMFLHEPGEANESYSRADLSALNAGSSQNGSGRPPPPQSQQPVASAAPPMIRQASADVPSSPSLDRPALPSTASWASKPPQIQRAEIRSVGPALEDQSPSNLNTSLPTQSESSHESDSAASSQLEDMRMNVETAHTSLRPERNRGPVVVSPLTSLLKDFRVDDLGLIWSSESIPAADLEIIQKFPPLFDRNGGSRRRLRRQREEEQSRIELEPLAFQNPPSDDQEDSLEMSGSFQLGGEPEDQPGGAQTQSAIHPPGQDGGSDQRFVFNGSVSSPGSSDRILTPQQHQQLLLQTLKPSAQPAFNMTSPNPTQVATHQQPSSAPGHQRNVSRYSFANDSASASTAVKPVANQKVLNQQTAMMPPAGAADFTQQHHSAHSQFFTSNVQGPPPGLKTTGTPPVSGNLTFGQGHGFATGGLQYGAGTSRNQDSYYRELLRGRESAGGVDAKHDSEFPSLRGPTRQMSISSRISLDESRRSTPPIPPGFEAQVANESRRGTPTVPPGLIKHHTLSDLAGNSLSRPSSRPASRTSTRRTASQIMPALPLQPATPSRHEPRDQSRIDQNETPTKLPRNAPPSDLKLAASAQDLETSSRCVAFNTGRKSLTFSPFDDTTAAADLGVHASAIEQLVASPPLPSVSPAEILDASDGQTKVAEDDTSGAPATPDSAAVGTGSTSKRVHPGRLNTKAAVDKAEGTQVIGADLVHVETPTKQHRGLPQTQSASRMLESPSVGSSSPAVKVVPRTLRVIQTPKAETPPPGLFTNLAGLNANKLPSRQPSVASNNPPGTPSSEHISMSDNISITSTSQSRANSPPLGASKVGSAPLRVKTKSRQKKDRQERAKAIEEEKSRGEGSTKPSSDEPAQEAIVSRKKKSKRDKEPKTRNTTPLPINALDLPTEHASSGPSSPPEPAAPVDPPSRSSQPAKSSAPGPSTPAMQPPAHATNEPSPPQTPTLTAAQLIADLKTSTPEIRKCIDSLFRVSNSSHSKNSQHLSAKDLGGLANWKSELKVNLTKDEVDALLTGKVPAIYYGSEAGRLWERGMITPSGAHLRALTKELEMRFLELEQALREMPEEFHFHPSKPQNEMKFPSIDLQALKRQFENATGRGVSVMEQMIQDGANLKKGAFLVDEASKYINEFVMPPVTPPPSNSPRPQATNGAPTASVEQAAPSVDIAERQLTEARRITDERESALRKMQKKNKRALGLS